MVSRFLILLLVLAPAATAAAPLGQAKKELDAAAGWALFKRAWVSAPSSQSGGAGLGPLFDARSCNACHAGGGAGQVGEDALGAGMVVRAGRADATADPVYGAQIQTLALPGFEPEAEISFQWEQTGGMRTARIDFAKFHYGPLAPDTHTALRRAPSLFGAGLLEDIPDGEIAAQTHGGRPSWITGADGKRKLGRWGWKAATPELTSQIEIAFQRDFGISTSGRPDAFGECTVAEKQCRTAGGNSVELPDESRDAIATYLRLLRRPAPRNEASPGFRLFRGAGCLDCHAILKDRKGGPVHAYTDMLLHDMGPGLDDGIAEGSARSPEWRTAPLWDVADNLAQGGLLHDGRARNIAEAVQWHGGEATPAHTAFDALSPAERTQIEDFLLGR
jgi:CxxC motif-containing protein (DUF1111 family)